MKITIAPSHAPEVFSGKPDCIQHSVTVEFPGDDVGLENAITLMVAALKAYGYSAEQIDQWIAPE